MAAKPAAPEITENQIKQSVNTVSKYLSEVRNFMGQLSVMRLVLMVRILVMHLRIVLAKHLRD